jgi:hypothetical protein
MAHHDGFLKDPHGKITKLAEMGITESAILTYIVSVGKGHPKDKALGALLAGRNLSTSQIDFIRSVLDRFPTPETSE